MLDLLFNQVEIVDGSGTPARIGNIGIHNGKITLRTEGESARETINGAGLTLCPGFIDAHSHGDLSLGTEHAITCKVSQGVTTEIGGQCGYSAFPTDPRFLDEMRGAITVSPDLYRMPYETFTSLDCFAAYGKGLSLPHNMATLVGHNTLRVSVMGVENRAPTAEEMALMKERLRLAMEQGAMGFSSGLIYVPGTYCNTDELIELCRVIKPYGGVYTTHMRNESRHVVESVKEAIAVAEAAGVPLVISHHKACGRDFWGKSKETLRLVEEATARGMKILLDQYPYEANMTSLNICLPPWHFADGNARLMEKLTDPAWRKILADEMKDPEGGYENFYRNSGGFDGIFVATSPKVPEAEGMTVAAYAAKMGKDPMDVYFDLLLANEGAGNGIYFSMDIGEVETIYLHPHTVVGSDGLCFGLKESSHPRAWGTFIRPLREFAEEKGLLSFEEAVAKQTSRTAAFWGLRDRGRIEEGYIADLVLLNRKTLYDRADYRHSNEKADGIEAVYVNGVCIYRDKHLTGAAPGKLLLRTDKLS